MIRQYELVELVKAYNPNVDEAVLNKAYVFGIKAHGGQKRHSGDPYFSHPLEVAAILTQLELDTASIVTAMLHDTIEDTDTTRADIARHFGEEVAKLVDGVTKLSRLDFAPPDGATQDGGTAFARYKETERAENFRKLLLAMSDDIRVLLVKLADRLHNMRTLRFMPKPESRERIARETLEIYAPLAGRVGMQNFREELEDLALRELHPDAYASIRQSLDKVEETARESHRQFESTLQALMIESGVSAKVSGRIKKPFAIWRKLQSKHLSLDGVHDVIGYRVLVDTPQDCYRALGALHLRMKVVPGRFKDHISTPKSNGYRSLHTTVIAPDGARVEVQIRTHEMHKIAEHGLAAHWRYKESGARGSRRGVSELEADAYSRLRQVIEAFDHGAPPDESLTNVAQELYHDQVFCFTPKGDLVNLPRKATPVDFAYALHSRIGDSCVGARVNGRQAPLRTVLQNGDQVEIIRGGDHSPSPAWQTFVVTGRARAAIRRALRIRERENQVRLGEDALRRWFATTDLELTSVALSEAARRLKIDRVDEVFERVGRGQLTARAVAEAAFPGATTGDDRAFPVITPIDGPSGVQEIVGLPDGARARLCPCCLPIPGDRIVGITGSGENVTAHAIDCALLTRYENDDGRWLDLKWENENVERRRAIRRAALTLDVVNAPGTLAAVTATIARARANISNVVFRHRNQDVFTMDVELEVRDLRHLEAILAGLRATEPVARVERRRASVDADTAEPAA